MSAMLTPIKKTSSASSPPASALGASFADLHVNMTSGGVAASAPLFLSLGELAGLGIGGS